MEESVFGLLLGAGIVAGFVGLIWYILQVIAYWKIFTKARIPGWHSIIPILNIWDHYKLSWQGMFGVLFMVLVCLSGMLTGTENSILRVIATVASLGSAAIRIICSFKLSKCFGHGVGFAIGLILLEPVFMLILGFSHDRYLGPQ